jgi:hypothetical protein
MYSIDITTGKRNLQGVNEIEYRVGMQDGKIFFVTTTQQYLVCAQERD